MTRRVRPVGVGVGMDSMTSGLPVWLFEVLEVGLECSAREGVIDGRIGCILPCRQQLSSSWAPWFLDYLVELVDEELRVDSAARGSCHQCTTIEAGFLIYYTTRAMQ